jgi:gamma-glutamyltranspeptidase/glutathione hydrolase
MKGAVSTGHPLTSASACEVLSRGGNAFDAALAAGFTAIVAEPCLASLGGGGFLLAHQAEGGRDVLYDFFVNAPGRGLRDCKAGLQAVDVKFRSTSQVFHIGMGSVAVPGALKGFLKCHQDLCTMDIRDITGPAIRCLEQGVEVNEFQRYLFEMLMPILTVTDYGRKIFLGLERGGSFYNPALMEFLAAPEAWFDTFYGSGAGEFADRFCAHGGLVTAEDLRGYEVVLREPLSCAYRGFEILGNPPPSFGGTLLVMAFSMLSRMRINRADEAGCLVKLVEVMAAMNRSRPGAGGTTHISVVDARGNAASMTFSNGSNSGIFLGETGVMLNNMMGEDDLFPGGFFTAEPGDRVGSMMSPALIKRDGGIYAVLGSGGSKRIKTAMLQVIFNLLERGMDAAGAVESLRMHLDDEGVLQLEPGFTQAALEALAGKYPLNQWDERDLYFGGVHTVMGDLSGRGDPRRGGCFMQAV